MNEREQFKANMENGSVQAWLDGGEWEWETDKDGWLPWNLCGVTPPQLLSRRKCRVKPKPVEVWAVVDQRGGGHLLRWSKPDEHEMNTDFRNFRVVRCVEQPE